MAYGPYLYHDEKHPHVLEVGIVLEVDVMSFCNFPKPTLNIWLTNHTSTTWTTRSTGHFLPDVTIPCLSLTKSTNQVHTPMK